MCRQLGYITKNDNGELVKAIAKFTKLASDGCVPCGVPKGHDDGHGGAVWQEGEVMFAKDQNKITSKSFNAFKEFLDSTKGSHGIFHLRKASVGGVSLGNTHPYTKSGIGFCHNGSIKPKDDNKYFCNVIVKEGDTDSEVFFLRILNNVENSINNNKLDSIRRAVLKEVSFIEQNFNWTSLTCILSTPEGLVLNYLWNENHPDATKYEFEKYYTFYEGRDGDDLYLCSEPIKIPKVKWTKLPNNTQNIYRI